MAHANDFDLDRRLRDLIAELGEISHFLIGSEVDSWVTAVKKARNNLTHLDEARRKFDGADLYWLAESLFQVTRLCLLLRIGLEDQGLSKIVQRIYRWSDLGQLERAVDQIAGLPPRA